MCGGWTGDGVTTRERLCVEVVTDTGAAHVGVFGMSDLGMSVIGIADSMEKPKEKQRRRIDSINCFTCTVSTVDADALTEWDIFSFIWRLK